MNSPTKTTTNLKVTLYSILAYLLPFIITIMILFGKAQNSGPYERLNTPFIYLFLTSSIFLLPTMLLSQYLLTTHIFKKYEVSIKTILTINLTIVLSMVLLTGTIALPGITKTYRCKQIIRAYIASEPKLDQDVINNCLTINENSKALAIYPVFWFYLGVYGAYSSLLNLLRIKGKTNPSAQLFYQAALLITVMLYVTLLYKTWVGLQNMQHLRGLREKNIMRY